VVIQSNNKIGAKTMSINISPLDQQVHLKQLEPTFGGSTYDHSGHPLTSWRAERQHAENNVSARKDQSKTVVGKKAPVTANNWIAKFVNLFTTPSFAD
jgi:hypothetical protein